jgi:TetR/AcrR family transcriptional repressor of nem operon
MRNSREVAEQNRKRVLRTASEAFRSHGYDGIGIASLMKAAGMTQGAFYKQFRSKEALEEEATALALEQNRRHWARSTEGAEDPVAALKEWYLSPRHVSALGEGCTYATLAAEATRERPGLQEVFGEALEAQIGALADALEGREAAPRAAAIQAMAQMIGTLLMARSVSDEALREEILAAGRAPE